MWICMCSETILGNCWEIVLSLIQYVQPWIRKLVEKKYPEGDTRACTSYRENNAVCTPVKEIISLCEWSIHVRIHIDLTQFTQKIYLWQIYRFTRISLFFFQMQNVWKIGLSQSSPIKYNWTTETAFVELRFITLEKNY